MSFSQAHLSDDSPAAQHYSVFNADPSAVPYPVVPKLRNDGTMGLGRRCDLCKSVIGIGSNGSLYSYDLHFTSCQKKYSRYTAGQLDRAVSLPVAPPTTTVPNRIHRPASLSPLIIGGSLHASLSPTPSPTSSPTFHLQPGFFDPGLDGNTRTSPSIQADPPYFFTTQTPLSRLTHHQMILIQLLR